MEAQNQPVGIPTSPYRKSKKKKLIIATVVGTVLLVTIVLGTTTSFMGKFVPKDGSVKDATTVDLTGEKDETKDNGKDLNITENLKAITSESILASNDVYIDSFETTKDDEGNYISFIADICTSQTDQDDLKVSVYLNTGDVSFPVDESTVDISAGNCIDDKEFLISDYFTSDIYLRSDITYTGIIMISPTTGDNITANNIKKTDEFTTSKAAVVGPSLLNNLGLTSDDETTPTIVRTETVSPDSLPSLFKNKDDTYISYVTRDENNYIVVTIGSTKSDITDLTTVVTVKKNTETLGENYFVSSIPKESTVTLSAIIDDFTNKKLEAGTYTITVTIDASGDHNEVTTNDSKEITFTILIEKTEEVDFDQPEIEWTEDNDEETADTEKNIYVESAGQDSTYPNNLYANICGEKTNGTESIKIGYYINEISDIIGGTSPKDGKCKKYYSSDVSTFALSTDKTYTLTVTADYYESIVESNEEDNIFESTITTESENTEADTTPEEEETTPPIVKDPYVATTAVLEGLKDAVGDATNEEGAEEEEPAESTGPKFTDTAGWYTDAVENLVDSGIIEGYKDGTFRGEKTINRAEIANIVYKAFLSELTENTNCEIEFTDVTDETAWYYEPIYTAACYGIVSGYPDGTYGPDNELSRAEALKVIMEASFIEDIPSSEHFIGSSDTWDNPYIDVYTNHWFYTYVMEAHYAEIITVANDFMYKPGETINRAETAVLIDRIITILLTVSI